MQTRFLDHPGPLAFAHRGGPAHAPENSWRAFGHAVGLGYRYLETDAQATADGVLIAFHDRTLERVTGRPGRVSRLSMADVAAARIGGTEPIPVLEDLLAAWPDVRFNIDIKDGPVIAPLAQVLQRTNAWDRVCVCSFSAARLWTARRVLDRPVCMAVSPLGAAVVRFGGPRGARGPDHRGPQRPEPAASPVPGRRPGGLPAGQASLLADRLARAGVQCAQVPVRVATAAFIARAHTLGLQVHVWTVNERPLMESLLDRAVDGIMTDETVVLREVLSGRGQWHPRVPG